MGQIEPLRKTVMKAIELRGFPKSEDLATWKEVLTLSWLEDCEKMFIDPVGRHEIFVNEIRAGDPRHDQLGDATILTLIGEVKTRVLPGGVIGDVIRE